MIKERIYPARFYLANHFTKTMRQVSEDTATIRLEGVLKDHCTRCETLLVEYEPTSSHASTMRVSRFTQSADPKNWSNGSPVGSSQVKWLPRWGATSIWKTSDELYRILPFNHSNESYFGHRIRHMPQDTTWSGSLANCDVFDRLEIIPGYGLGDGSGDNNVTAYITISLKSIYKDVEWEEVVPTVTASSPAMGSAVDNANPITFSWTYDGHKSFSGAYNHQANALLEWKEASSEEIHQGGTVTGDVWSITLPAGTLPEKASLQWRITATSEFGAVVTTNWVDISTTNTTPYAPVDLFPADVNVDNNGPVQFSWRHDIATGEVQTLAELQYSGDNGSSWQALGSITGDAQSYTVPAHSLPTGLVEWRVRTAGRTGVYGPWSQHTKIIVKASPPAPIISQVSASPRPAVQWQSVGQQGYRVIFQGEGVSCDTGIHYGVERSAKCPMYLPDGAVTITVQVVNSIGAWSESSVTANVSNVDTQMAAPPVPEPSLHTRNGVVYLTWPQPQRYTRYYVLRDGQPIAVVMDGTYEDKTAAGRPEYRILGVYGKDADFYVASRAIPITVSVYSAMLVDMDAQQSLVYLRLHRDSPPTAKRTVSAYVEYQTFAGQTHPTPIFAGARTEGLDLEYTVLHRERQALVDMIGHRVCVKLRDGSAMFAILENIQENIWKRADVVLHFNRVEYSEVIAYV